MFGLFLINYQLLRVDRGIFLIVCTIFAPTSLVGQSIYRDRANNVHVSLLYTAIVVFAENFIPSPLLNEGESD